MDDVISISMSARIMCSTPDKYTVPVRGYIGHSFASAAISSETRSRLVKSIGIELHLSERIPPAQPYIGKISRIDGSLGLGIELTWLVNRDLDEPTARMMMGKPLLGLLRAAFRIHDIPEEEFLKSLAANPGWSEIIDSLSLTEIESYMSCASSIRITMDEEKFWDLIDRSKQSSMSNDEQETHLVAELSKLPAEDVREFATIYREKMVESYRYDIWAIAYIINCGCSDSGFTEFRAWLIAQGREFFKQAIIRPEFIGEAVPIEATQQNSPNSTFGGLDLVACRIFEEITGHEIFINYSSEPHKAIGEPWNDDELPMLHPALCKKFGWFDE